MTIDLAAEKALLRRALDGDKKAANHLVGLWRPLIAGSARKWRRRIYHSQSDRISLGDLENEAWIEVWRKLPDYNFDSDARPINWLHRWIESAIKRYLCRNLESTHIGSDSVNHAAHREIEAGADPDELASRKKISKERARSLVRHTVGIEAAARIGTDHDVVRLEESAEEQRKIAAIEAAYPRLGEAQRHIISGLRLGWTEERLAGLLPHLVKGMKREHVSAYIAWTRAQLSNLIREG